MLNFESNFFFQFTCCASCRKLELNASLPFGSEYYGNDSNGSNSNQSIKTSAPFGRSFYNHSHELYPYEKHINIPEISRENSQNKDEKMLISKEGNSTKQP